MFLVAAGVGPDRACGCAASGGPGGCPPRHLLLPQEGCRGRGVRQGRRQPLRDNQRLGLHYKH